MRTALLLYGAVAAGLVAAVFLSMSAIYLFPARWKLGVSYFVIGLGLMVAAIATAGRI